MGWRPKDFWRATIPEVVGAIIGDNNKKIEELKLAWEPARFVAYVFYQMNAGKKDKLRNERELRSFAWEKPAHRKGEAKKVIESVMRFRDVVKNKWGLKYLNE